MEPMMSRRFSHIRTLLSARRGNEAFTLVELMTVLLIGLIITGLAIPAISTMLLSMNLTQAGQMVTSQVGLANQIAGSRGCTVEVRLIRSPNATVATPYYFAIQLFAITSGGVSTPVNHPALLPANTVIAGDQTTLSPYLPYLQAPASAPTMTMGAVTYSYASFRISPQGLVTPYAPFTALYLTVVPFTSATAAAAPTNYVTVQVNPATGTELVYRP
jgi:uncharacterized protein (TIGR02596 family)